MSTRLRKFGRTDALGTTEQTVWTQGGNYPWQTTAQTIYLASSNAGDTQVIQVWFIDQNGVEIEGEEVTLNGQTSVPLSDTGYMVNRMVLKSDSASEPAGDVYAGFGTNTAGVPATVLAKIDQGTNQTLQAAFTVGAGKTLDLTGLQVTGFGSANANTEVRLVVVTDGIDYVTKTLFTLYRSGFQWELASFYPAGTRIEVRAVSSGGTANEVSAEFFGKLI